MSASSFFFDQQVTILKPFDNGKYEFSIFVLLLRQARQTEQIGLRYTVQ